MSALLFPFAVCILSSFFIILSSYPLYALFWWILLISSSSLFILSLGLGFLAFSYFILYIGAILILFLFVIMTLHNTFYFVNRPLTISAAAAALLTFSISYLLSLPGTVYYMPTQFAGYRDALPAPFFFDILSSLAYPLFTFYSFLWYPCTLLLSLCLLFPIYLLLS